MTLRKVWSLLTQVEAIQNQVIPDLLCLLQLVNESNVRAIGLCRALMQLAAQATLNGWPFALQLSDTGEALHREIPKYY